MPEPQTQIQPSTPETPGEEDVDTEAEFHTLWTDAAEGKTRFAALAKAAQDAGNTELATVYREIGATVMSLLVDITAATGGAFMYVEEELERVEAGETTASTLLQEDAEKYIQLFEQFLKLLDGLDGIIPDGIEGARQREIFETLRRATNGMMEFTREITVDDDNPADAPEGEPDPDDDDDE